jgi:SHS2 domain-containing protein
MKKFEFLPHTADIKIRVYGKNLKEIINNSLLALKSFWKPKLTKIKIEKEIRIESNNEIKVLIDFLSEVLAKTYIEKAIFVKFIRDLSKACPNANRINYPNNSIYPNEGLNNGIYPNNRQNKLSESGDKIFDQCSGKSLDYNSGNPLGYNSGSNIKFGPNLGNDSVYSLSGKIIGYQFISISKDIKAITYHQANLKKNKNYYIFDFIIDI